MIVEFFIINVIILDILVGYFLIGSKIKKFIQRRLLKSKCLQ